MPPLRVRPGEIADLPALTEIYNHYIAHTATTFETRPKTVADRREWFDLHTGGALRLWVIGPEDGPVIGWAETGRFRPRPAYDTTVEVSVYLRPDAVGQGLGNRLYAALFDSIAAEPLHRAVAVIALPNPASVAFHQRWGFREVGRLPEVGWKFGRFWDTGLFCRPLQAGSPARPGEETLISPVGSGRSQGELGTG